MKALIFDCDGVLVDTERDGHRVAFNRSFVKKGYDFEWDIPLYGELLKVAGGKERMRHYFNQHGWPPSVDDRDTFLKDMHKLKTDIFMEIIAGGQLSLRPGIRRLVDEGISANVVLAVCSTSNERAVNLIVQTLLGPERQAKFQAILAGDVVSQKKPDPEIYHLARTILGLRSDECVVIEDSHNGLRAAKAAGMHCVVTTNSYTRSEDFSDADLVVPELGDKPDIKVNLHTLNAIAARKH